MRKLEEIGAGIAERLQARQAEIEKIIFDDLRSTAPDPVGDKDPEYAEGLSVAVAAGVGYCLLAIQRGEKQSGPIPAALIEQARRAARSGVSMETMMRRVSIAERLVKKFATDEADDVPARALDQMMSVLGATIDGLMEALAKEYSRVRSPDQGRKEIVRRLLANESVEPAELAGLGYDIHASWHLGVIATGERAESVIGTLKPSFGRRLLLVTQDDGIIWVWFAGTRKPTVAEIERMLSPSEHPGISVAVGEPGQRLDGWRQTHREAQAALLVALCEPRRFARYGECHFLAAARQIDTLAKSLTQKYVIPLRSERDGGATLRKTLRAWVETEGYASSAAKILKVDRHTVENHIRTVERLTGRPLRRSCLTELDVALRLEEFDGAPTLESHRPQGKKPPKKG